MNFSSRQLKPMEQAGILVAVMVIGLYGYMNFVQASPSRKMQRIERKYEETVRAVEKLGKEKASGRMDRVLKRLRKRVDLSEKKLLEAEGVLAGIQEKDEIATKILQMASEKGFMIQDYSRVTDKNRIQEVCGGKDSYALSYYSMTLRGRFGLLIELLRGFEAFPKLVALRKILVDMPDDGSALFTEIWFSI